MILNHKRTQVWQVLSVSPVQCTVTHVTGQNYICDCLPKQLVSVCLSSNVVVVVTHLVCDLTIWQPCFNLPQQQWSLLNRFRMEQGHCGACRRKWQLIDTDLCPSGETQTMSHIVKSCPLIKLNCGLSRLHSADEDAVSWLNSYGS